MEPKIKALVLAAGKGTRLRTEGVDLPKVLRQADGKPLLHYVLSALDFLPPTPFWSSAGRRRRCGRPSPATPMPCRRR